MESPRVSLSEAAEAAGVSRTTLYRRIVAGELAAVRSARDRRRRLVDLAEVLAIFEERAA